MVCYYQPSQYSLHNWLAVEFEVKLNDRRCEVVTSQPVVVEVAQFESHVPTQRDWYNVDDEHDGHWIEQHSRLSQERQRYVQQTQIIINIAITITIIRNVLT